MDKYWYLPKAAIPPPPEIKQLRVKIIDPYERDEPPDFCHIVELPDMWVSDALEGIFDKWCTRQPVGIWAPTGRGKTTFARSVVRHCRGHTEVLYLCHRRMIGGQQKMAMCRGLGSAWGKVNDPKAFELTDRFEDIGLTVMSYQKFAARYRDLDLTRFGWVILDECHYFHSDALFNKYADDLLERIPQLFRHAHRVYMTATPDAVLPDICRVEAESMQGCSPHCSCCRETCGQMLCYHFPDDFDRIKLSAFKQRSEIVELVKSHPDEKFLIFTSAREDEDTVPEKSYKKLLEAAGIEAAYLDRFEKGSEAWDDLCTNEHFQKRVLICTSVLDCGVNIHDDALRHIVIETTDRTEFFQMLGRKRRKKDESVRVYIRAFGVSTLRSRLQQTDRWIGIAEEAMNAFATDQFTRIFRRGWYDESPGNPYPHILRPLKDGRTEVKPTAYHALRRQRATLARLLEDHREKGDAALPLMAAQWLGRSLDVSEVNWLGESARETAKAELKNYLAGLEGKPLSSAKWADALDHITDLIGAVLKEPHDSERDLGYKAINNRLKRLEIPFVIISNGSGNYVIKSAPMETESKEV